MIYLSIYLFIYILKNSFQPTTTQYNILFLNSFQWYNSNSIMTVQGKVAEIRDMEFESVLHSKKKKNLIQGPIHSHFGTLALLWSNFLLILEIVVVPKQNPKKKLGNTECKPVVVVVVVLLLLLLLWELLPFEHTRLVLV